MTEVDKPAQVFRPSQYMRERRPQLFSDTTSIKETILTREVLSYHLETLTNQKDESKFEKFAHRLVEKFISPNLKPQTGPTGGGDGKTDAETIPVAAEIALRWFATEHAKPNERFAFAFSAKKDWRAKIRADVASVISTGRDYDHIFFVSNQYIAAKDSARVQDGLVQKHGTRITILDRTWLLSKVFDADSVDIAIAELGVGQATERDVEKLGPRDLERAAELERIESAIQSGTDYASSPIGFAEDAIRVAVLSRYLERPRHETTGRFDRAVRIAQDRGLKKQEIAAVYEWAWTSYFWQEDLRRTSELYAQLENLVIGADDAEDLERLNNILPLLRIAGASGDVPLDLEIEQRGERLQSELKRVAAISGRPNNALHAQALYLMSELSRRMVKDRSDDLSDLWPAFRDMVQQAKGLGSFPFLSIAEVLTEAGGYIIESVEFDALYEQVTDALADRSKEGEAAKKNVQRAYQKLEKDLPYDAIRWFGRATHLLVKDEYADELAEALLGASIAYERVGLLWAARTYAVSALGHQLAAFVKTGSVFDVNPVLVKRVFVLEVRLGRLPNILSLHELELMVRIGRAQTVEQKTLLEAAKYDHDMMVGALLLRADADQLVALQRLPDALERLALVRSAGLLEILLGHDADYLQLPNGKIDNPEQAQDEFLNRWYSAGDDIGLPPKLDTADREEVVLRSRVLGCELILECDNNLTSLSVGEAFLGATEALLSTSLAHRMMPQRDRLIIRVAPGDEGTPLHIRFEEEGGELVGVVVHPSRFTSTTREEVMVFPTWLAEAVLEATVKLVLPFDLEGWRQAVFGDESAFDRAIVFSNLPALAYNLYGEKERLSLTDWAESGDRDYSFIREAPWRPAVQEETHLGENDDLPVLDRGDEKLRHDQITVLSPIESQKWDAAKWDATLFMSAPDDREMVPFLGLAFKNREPAQSIFAGLRKRFGDEDLDDSLRIAIIRGISSKNPSAYAVIVGPNPAHLKSTGSGVFYFASRINRMYPINASNLELFLGQYAVHGRFVLMPAHFPNRESQPEPMWNFPIGKHHLTVRNAWEIGENDLDSMALDLGDLPVIPLDKPDAPVWKALEQLRKFRG